MNEKGALTLFLLDALREARSRIERNEPVEQPERLIDMIAARGGVDESDPASIRRATEAALDDLIESGEDVFVPFWQDAVHSGGRVALSQTMSDAGQTQSDWETWTDLGLPMTSAVGVPEAKRRWRDEPPTKWAKSGR